MQGKIAKRLATNQKAHMDFITQGKIPRLKSPNRTPLWELLSKISPSHRTRIKGVKLSPTLGYNNSTVFANAEQLFNWLGGNKLIGEWESNPADQCSIKRFSRKISLDEFLKNCSSYPDIRMRR